MTFGLLAAAAPASDNVTPGLLGFVVFAVMAVALFFLLKSMNKQFRKIAPKDEAPAPGGAGSKPGQNERVPRDEPAPQEAPK